MQQQLDLTNQSLGVLPSFLSALTVALIMVVGGVRVINGYFTIGMLVAFQSLMASFLQPLNNLLGLGGAIQEMQGGMNRLDDILLEKQDPAAREDDASASNRKRD